MENGMHVLLFSDNVSLEKEIELKDYAVEHNLLMMGPDWRHRHNKRRGSGFANIVRQGNIGIVGRRGHRSAGGHRDNRPAGRGHLPGPGHPAAGTSRRPLGGRMMLLALEA